MSLFKDNLLNPNRTANP